MKLTLHPRRGVAAWLFAASALTVMVALPVGAGAASTPFAKYKTKGCPQDAPNWRIGYRFFFSAPSGATLAHDGTVKAAQTAAKKFVEQVGSFSRCGVRAQIELFDEGNEVWQGCVEGAAGCGFGKYFPPDTDGFRKARKLDAVFNRYPRQGDDSAGLVSPVAFGDQGAVGFAARFPVDPAKPNAQEGNPWRNLLIHEWLHMVVGHVSNANWPRPSGGDPVHAGCQIEPYRSADFRTFDGPCIAQGRYFRDLMRREVKLNGRSKGITKKLWLLCGTPTHQPADKAKKTCQRAR